MRRTGHAPLTQNALNVRSSLAPSAMRNPHSGIALHDVNDRQAPKFVNTKGRRSTATLVQGRRPSGPVRHSSALPSGSRGPRQDPRPLTDRTYMHQCMKNLVAFLIDRGYDNQITVKALANPSSKDFVSIFLFLVNRIDPTFVFQKRFEEELPAVLKCLGYPFTISRSALSAIGSPHTWPMLLGVLMYLVGLINCDEALEAHDKKQEADYNKRREDIFHENTTKAYVQWLQGAESFPELDKELDDFFKAESGTREERISQLEVSVRQLKITEESLSTQPSPLQLCKEHLASLESNVNKFKLLLPSLAEHLNGVEKKVKEKEEELERCNSELASLKKKKAQLEPILARQMDEAIDAERIVSDREKLQTALKRSQAERELAEREQKELERRVADKYERLNTLVNEYHRDLEAYDVQGREGDLHGWQGKERLSFTVTRDATVTDPAEILSKDVKLEVLPKIEEMRNAFTSAMPSLQQARLRLHEEVDEIEERMILLRHEVSVLEGQYQQRETEYERKKEDLQECLEERSKEILRSEEERNALLKKVESEIQESDRQMKELVVYKDNLMKAQERDRAQLIEILANNIQKAIKHQQAIREDTTQMKAHLENALSLAVYKHQAKFGEKEIE